MNENNFLQSETPPRWSILVVDDDRDVRRLNTEILAGKGYQVDAAADGAIAWDMIQLKQYDLVITDNNMPNLTGIGLIQKLHAAGLNLPVIMVTGTRPQDELYQQPWLQIEAVLLKPYTFDELLGVVKNVLCATGSDGQEIAQPNRQNPANDTGLRL